MISSSAKITSLDPQVVDASGSWLFWARDPDEQFRQSLRELGQLEPVLVAHDPGGLSLVAGYKRLKACHEQGAAVQAVQIEADTVTRGWIYFQSNRQSRLDSKDLVLAGRFFSQHLGQEELLNILRRMVPSGADARLPDLICRWLYLPADWDNLLQAGHIPLQATHWLSRLEEEELQALHPFFRELRWSESNARKFLARLTETSLRERTSLSSLIQDSKLESILQQDLSPKDRVQRLMHEARRLRYPELTKLEDEFSDLVRQISQDSKWKITADPSFETDRLGLSLAVSSPRELEEAVKELQRMTERNELSRIWQWQWERLGK